MGKKDIIESAEVESEGEMENEPGDGVISEEESEEGSEMGTTLVLGGDDRSDDENYGASSSQDSELPPLQPPEELVSEDTPSSPEVQFEEPVSKDTPSSPEVQFEEPVDEEEIPAPQVHGSPQSSDSESLECPTPDRTTASRLHDEEFFSTPPESEKSEYRREEVVEMCISLMEFFGKEHPEILKNLDLLFGGYHAFDDLLLYTPNNLPHKGRSLQNIFRVYVCTVLTPKELQLSPLHGSLRVEFCSLWFGSFIMVGNQGILGELAETLPGSGKQGSWVGTLLPMCFVCFCMVNVLRTWAFKRIQKRFMLWSFMFGVVVRHEVQNPNI